MVPLGTDGVEVSDFPCLSVCVAVVVIVTLKIDPNAPIVSFLDIAYKSVSVVKMM